MPRPARRVVPPVVPVVRKDPSAQIAGALARKAGASLEAALSAVHDWYDRRGEAAIEKVNPPVLGWGDSLRVGHSTVDYTGTVKTLPPRYEDAATRRGIAFDAKMVTGAATFGAEHVGQGKHAARNRVRFFRQVEYLRGLRDRHGYAAFFLLYCAELETLWLCADLDTLATGASVPIRTKRRPTKADPTPAVVHHLPRLVGGPGALERAAVPQLATRRPLLDYLSLVR